MEFETEKSNFDSFQESILRVLCSETQLMNIGMDIKFINLAETAPDKF